MPLLTLNDETSPFMNTYRREINLIRGDGCYVWGDNDKKYLDFVTGLGVNLLGYRNDALVKAAKDQIDLMTHCSNLFFNSTQTEYAKLLTTTSSFQRVYFCNSGTEANETAIKIARRYGRGRYQIVCSHNSFHGRTLGSLSATGDAKARAGFAPLLDGFLHVPFNDIDSLERSLTDQTCAVLLEPILNHAGIIVPDYNYLKEVEELCRKKGVLFILDESITSFGRLGKLFGHEYFGVNPDMITVAKPAGGGFPLGIVMAKQVLAPFVSPGEHGSTFGGNLVACAAGSALFRQVSNPELLKNVSEKAELLMKELHRLKHKLHYLIKDIRGVGLMIGIELWHESEKLLSSCIQNGILVDVLGNRIIRIFPPLILEEEQINEFSLSLHNSLRML